MLPAVLLFFSASANSAPELSFSTVIHAHADSTPCRMYSRISNEYKTGVLSLARTLQEWSNSEDGLWLDHRFWEEGIPDGQSKCSTLHRI